MSYHIDKICKVDFGEQVIIFIKNVEYFSKDFIFLK